MDKIVGCLKGFLIKIGDIVSWINVLLVLVIILQVILRYGLGEGMIALEELQWHCYALCIMVGFSYTDAKDAHVKVDLISSKFSPKANAYIELFGTLFLLIPFLIVVIDHGLEYTKTSFASMEKSPSPGGLPFRWLIKSLIPLSMFLMMLSAFSKIIRSISFIKNHNTSGESHGS